MADLPVASALASNFRFSVFKYSLDDADLFGRLDEAPALTVFAPTNLAFIDIPFERRRALKADLKESTRMLQQHVIVGRLSSEQLVGTHTTLAGGKLVMQSENGVTTVNGIAKVICAEIQTLNATVYVIDAVLASS